MENSNAFSLPTGVAAGWSRVSPNFFDAFGLPVIAGRTFDADEAARTEPVVVVSEMFAERFLGGGQALGARIRPARQGGGSWGLREGGVWYTVIGVVPDLATAVSPLAIEPKVFQPLATGVQERASFAVRLRTGDAGPRDLDRMRTLALQVDPMLQLQGLTVVEEIYALGAAAARLMTLIIVSIALAVLLLSVAGLYALMSFTVVRRHRHSINSSTRSAGRIHASRSGIE